MERRFKNGDNNKNLYRASNVAICKILKDRISAINKEITMEKRINSSLGDIKDGIYKRIRAPLEEDEGYKKAAQELKELLTDKIVGNISKMNLNLMEDKIVDCIMNGEITVRETSLSIVKEGQNLKEQIIQIDKALKVYDGHVDDIEKIRHLEDLMIVDQDNQKFEYHFKEQLSSLEKKLVTEKEESALNFAQDMKMKRKDARHKRIQEYKRVKNKQEKEDKMVKKQERLKRKEEMEDKKDQLEKRTDQYNKRFIEKDKIFKQRNQDLEKILQDKKIKDEKWKARLDEQASKIKKQQDEQRSRLNFLKQRERQQILAIRARHHNLLEKNRTFEKQAEVQGSLVFNRKGSKEGSKKFNSSQEERYYHLIKREREYKRRQDIDYIKRKNLKKGIQYSKSQQKAHAPSRSLNIQKTLDASDGLKRKANFGYYYKQDILKRQEKNINDEVSKNLFLKGRVKRKPNHSMSYGSKSEINLQNKISKTPQNLPTPSTKISRKKYLKSEEKSNSSSRIIPKNYLNQVRKEFVLKKSENDWERYLKQAKEDNSKENSTPQERVDNFSNFNSPYDKIIREAQRLENEAVEAENIQRKFKKFNMADSLKRKQKDIDSLYCNSIKAKLAVLDNLQEQYFCNYPTYPPTPQYKYQYDIFPTMSQGEGRKRNLSLNSNQQQLIVSELSYQYILSSISYRSQTQNTKI